MATSEHIYKFSISMSCGGCSSSVERVIKELNGLRSYEVSLTEQRATIVADPSLEYTTVLRAIQKSGKKIISGEADGVSMSIEVEE
ncbi:hypothetical protein M430DRAFT_34931 [Amorphotheca resinae ATCC 22711]|uniref:HMA domain-containing protein n=1 Tax=Amorphotheca resinae ATCC 22711 TaxID=857342 RepID=A0A2T3B1C5_AMORE|nr:hypothetical protein M430DRAFT_34931 [Amorphotheca resinae ATCC 22711]PSS18357.1 hypothetical protein M430DRAFT_34931 [Amorphotheca resinae ATCC 22711]